jgi:hypothetical protein
MMGIMPKINVDHHIRIPAPSIHRRRSALRRRRPTHLEERLMSAAQKLESL